jgi:hypothetical protein
MRYLIFLNFLSKKTGNHAELSFRIFYSNPPVEKKQGKSFGSYKKVSFYNMYEYAPGVSFGP